MKPKIRKSLLTLLFIILVFYSVSSINIILHKIQSNDNYYQEFDLLKTQNNQMDYDIKILKIKISGLTKENLNKDLLEERAKSLLNKIKAGEIIVVK